MTISDAQKKVDDWIQKYGVRYFSELSNMAQLTEEVGELARLISRLYGDQSFKNPKDEETAKEKIGDELADVLWVVICMANQMDIDLTMALKENLHKKTTRDSRRHINNKKL